MSRYGYLAMAWLFVALGFVGIFVPLLPTTPFLLAAVWAFGKSSPVLARWLRGHAVLGPYIRDWQDGGVIPLRAKIIAVIMMTASFVWIVAGVGAPVLVTVSVGLLLLAAAGFVLTRPSRRE